MKPRLVALALFVALANASAATYRVGDIVTNFTLIARHPYTNEAGRVFASNAPVQLHDLAGKIIFFEFFAVW